MKHKQTHKVLMPEQVIIEKSLSSVDIRFGPNVTEVTVKVYDDSIETAGRLAIAEFERLLKKVQLVDKTFRVIKEKPKKKEKQKKS